MPVTASLKNRASKTSGKKPGRVVVRAKRMPLPSQPGFDSTKALDETARLAKTLPLGSVFRCPVTGLLVVNGPPITSEEVYEHFY
jgi:hypothetical protein